MALFLGKFEYVVDEKGRVNIPARFREQLAKESDPTLALFKGLDGCVFIYPLSALDKFRSNFEKSQFTSTELARLLQRLLADGGSTGQPDSQGRITLSEEQRTYAGLEREVVIFGNFERIEIWNPDRLKQALAKPSEMNLDIDDLAQRFFGDPVGQERS